jgi:UDP-glucose 4-epimerase
MKNVLITGGLGYIGSRIASYLAQYTDYSISITTRKSILETSSFGIPKNITIIHAAGVESKAMYEAVNKADVIIHLAALNEIDSIKNPAEALKINVLDSFSILELAVKYNTHRFIYFSTAHIYGAPLKGHITEKFVPRPVHPYALTHRAFEDFVTAAADNKKISTAVLRLSNSFGPPAFLSADRWSLLINDLCRQGITTGKMKLNSSGLQQRDFITLFDVCRSVKHFIEIPDENLGNGIFNLGGNNAARIIDMANMIKERFMVVCGKEIMLLVPEAKESELNENHSLHYDIKKLLGTGFVLNNNVVEEIDNTILFCKKYFS